MVPKHAIGNKRLIPILSVLSTIRYCRTGPCSQRQAIALVPVMDLYLQVRGSSTQLVCSVISVMPSGRLAKRSPDVHLIPPLTLRAPLSGTFLQTLPDLVTPLKGALFIFAQLSTDAVSALPKGFCTDLRLWKQPSTQART